jgi:hypothetical protein
MCQTASLVNNGFFELVLKSLQANYIGIRTTSRLDNGANFTRIAIIENEIPVTERPANN